MMFWPDLIVLPIVLPLVAGAFLVLLGRRRPGLARWISLSNMLALLLVAALLLIQASTGEIQAYLLSNWRAPFGIALALDRLSALMLMITALIALPALIYATGGDDQRGAHFHALFQFQLMGLNGAFLTADLFNLFVFFEVLLIASYGLLLHGGGAQRLKASIHYISFNLAGSALFLIAVSLLYGLTGTLNMADLSQRIAQLGEDRALLVRSAALLLLTVFCIKAALLPLNFWLSDTYRSASAAVAALFAIMTKVGVYALLRVTTLMFGADAGPAADAAWPWLPVLALATLAFAAISALAAQHLGGIVVASLIASAGTLLLAVGLATPASVAAGLFYLVNSTLVGAAMFLLLDRIRLARGASADCLQPALFGSSRIALGSVFFVLAVAAAGMPPLAGFFGKALLLQAAGTTAIAGWVIVIVLASSLLLMVALSRGGSVLFWKLPEPTVAMETSTRAQARYPATGSVMAVAVVSGVVTAGANSAPHAVASAGAGAGADADGAAARLSLTLLLLMIMSCSVFAGTLSGYAHATAAQLFSRQSYVGAVLGARPVAPAIDIRREMRERRARQP